MIEVNPLGCINDFAGLQRIMRERKDQLGISNNCLDELAGLSDGYANKLMARPPAKNLGTLTFDLLLQALGLKLIVVEDLETMQRYASQLVQRQEKQVRAASEASLARHKKYTIVFSRKFLQKMGALGGKKRAENLSPRRLRQIGIKGAEARWKRRKAARRERAGSTA
jgi:hypothetical protein